MFLFYLYYFSQNCEISNSFAYSQQEHTNDNSLQRQPLQATPSMCYHCFDVLIDALKNNGIGRSNNSGFSRELIDSSIECPLFITWERQRNNSWQLRGCIGTLSPRLLVPSVGEYALTSAFRDRRFKPIGLSEVSSLRVAVSLLVTYEICRDVYDWTVGVHGILIKFTVGSQRYNATYLPDVAKDQGWDHAKTLASLIHKAGYHGPSTTELLGIIHCTRYQSSKHKLSFEEYVTHHCGGENPLPPNGIKERNWTPSSCNIN